MARKQPHESEPSASPTRSGRRLRRRLFVAGLVLAVPVLLFFLLTRSPLTAMITAPFLESLTGADVTVRSATIDIRGSVALRGVSADAPGVDGPAANFVRVDEIDAEFSWLDLVKGRGVRSVTLLAPRLRLSQSSETQLLNISGVSLLKPSAPGGAALPTVIVDDASLEIGEHTGSAYQPLSVIHFDAAVIPDPSSTGNASTIRMTTLAPEGPILGVPGQDITGRIDQDAITITPAELSLTSLRPSALPATARRELELLDLKGRLRLRSFTYTFASGRVEAEVVLRGVEMNLPIQAAGEDGVLAPLRLSAVNGIVGLRSDRIRADLKGKVADLPYTVRLDYQGSTIDAPFTCELNTDGYHVSSRPDLLPFAPPIVRERLADFSNPTATVSTHVTISRNAPTADGPAPVRVRGTLDFRDGAASFHEFPYVFKQLTGSATFDDEKIVLNAIEGVADTGARIHVTGTVAPPTELAVVDIVARVTGVPVDDAIADALGPERREVITALFSQTRHRELVENGLVLGTAEADHLRQDLDRLRAMPAPTAEAAARLAAVEETLARTPVFDVGGKAEVTVHVTRPYGYLTPWKTDVIVSFVTLGVLPEAFPLPIVATDVRLHISDDEAVLERGAYRTLRGGLASVDCTVDLFGPDGERDFIPRIDIVAGGIPVDDLLIHALPEQGMERRSGPSAREALTGLDLDGAIDIRARIEPRVDGELGYAVDADLPGLRASPISRPGEPGIALESIRGTLGVTEESLRASIRSDLVSIPDPDRPLEGNAPAGVASFDLNVVLGERSSSVAKGSIKDLDAAAPFEDAIRSLSPEAADRLASLRTRLRPRGVLDAEIEATASDASTRAVVTVSNIRDASFDALDGRVALSVVEGSVIADADASEDAGAVIRFDDFVAAIDHDGDPIGRVAMEGDLSLDPNGVEAARTDLHMDWADAPLDSSAIRALLRQSLGDAAHAVYTEHDPIGRFDLDLRLAPKPDVPEGATATLGAWGALRPRGLSIVRYGTRIEFPGAGGALRFSPEGGSFDHLTLDAQGISLSADGWWKLSPSDGRHTVEVVLNGWATEQGRAVSALLPARLHEMAEASEFAVDGTMRLEEVRLSILGDPRATDAAIQASGAISLEGASMRLGLPITDLSGVVRFIAGTEAGSSTFDVGLISPSLHLAKLRITDARVRVASDPNDPRVIVPLISGATHGGRLSGRATIGPAAADPQTREFLASIHVAGARFASVLADLSSETVVAPSDGPDPSRGLLDAEFTMRGIVGDNESTVGRGEFAVSGGEVLSLPLLLPIIQVTNLQVPTAENLDLALASFHLAEGQVVFEELSVFSRSVELFGYGTMVWPEGELDLRIISRAARPFPIVSSIVEAVRNELISVRVGGTLAKPDVSLSQFSSTRGLMRRILGSTPSEQNRQMEQIRLRAYSDQDRVRRAGERIKDLARTPAMKGE